MDRPDGSTATVIGWCLVIAGVLAAFFVGQVDSPTAFWLCLAIANLGVGLGVLLLSLGYLVRAIWFLPGRQTKSDRDRPLSEVTVTDPDECEWCGIVVTAPAKPCSAFTTEQLPIAAGRIKSVTCRNQLEARGHLL
jgi:hypothetical protein